MQPLSVATLRKQNMRFGSWPWFLAELYQRNERKQADLRFKAEQEKWGPKVEEAICKLKALRPEMSKEEHEKQDARAAAITKEIHDAFKR